MNYLNNIVPGIFISLFCLFVPHNQHAQITLRIAEPVKDYQIINDTIIINESYRDSYFTPVLVNKGSFIKSDCDSLYIVNNIRYNFYNRLRKYLTEKGSIYNDSLAFTYQNLLDDCERDYDLLLQNCDSSSLLLKSSLHLAESELNSASRSLQVSQQTLNNVKSSLNQANELLEKEKQGRFFDNMTYAIGGLGLGVLIALLLQ